MTIASEIQDLQTNLAAAKNAVVAKGGTTGNTGLAGLANEIAGIPSGGGGGPIPVYGKIEYHSWTSSASAEFSDGCTIDNIDERVFFKYLSSLDDGSGTGSSPTSAGFNYNGNGWVCDYDQETVILPEEMETKTGITVTVDGSWASFMVEKQTTVDTNSPLNSWYLSSNAGLDSFANSMNSSSYYINDGLIIPSGAIVSFQCGTSVTSLPGYFMYMIPNLTTVDLSHANNLTTIGESVFASCYNLTSFADLPSSITTIGVNFMSGNTSFNQPIVLPSSLTSLGSGFLNGCNQMVSTVDVGSIPASVCQTYPADYTFVMSSSSAPAYTTGITLTGTTASNWAATLPNLAAPSRYRNLIVAS